MSTHHDRLRGMPFAVLYFTRTSPGSSVWVCKCGKHRTQNGSGYSNLMSHIEREHPEFVHYDALDPATQQSVFASLTPKPVQAVHRWLTWITASLMPFSFCENDMARRFTTLGTISVKTLMKWMHVMGRWMESKISETLPESFAIVYDGWTSGSTHYVAMFATFPNDSHRGYEKILLAMSPMNEEDSLSAAAHVQYLDFVLGVYGKDRENVVALIGYNCSTNRAFSRLAGVPMTGCASHRFNLFVDDVLAEHEELLVAVNAIMKKQTNIIPSLKSFLPLMGVEEIDNLLLSVRQDLDIDLLLAKLIDLNSVTFELQDEAITLDDVCGLFDEVVGEFPSANERLGPGASIIQDPHFETGVVKVLMHMSPSQERLSIARLAVTAGIRDDDRMSDADCMSMASRAKKRRKLQQSCSGFMDCRFLRPTSNMCERLFSVTKWALTDRRQSMLPSNFRRTNVPSLQHLPLGYRRRQECNGRSTGGDGF
ncbi:hypothetical protein DYB26_007287 [Aphanomyces astaci]|uniref:BED-type domain-containing protein n=1 Tax=Aphanomyces astaci TaxID=112090 RepID=A0A397FHH7_APHAT|nr:hypothetical protein DYB31_009457 [Aphanomyces astaci]RHZ34895.1 hypothetical protein DYB26_007287 [Aphanomyces astaci]